MAWNLTFKAATFLTLKMQQLSKLFYEKHNMQLHIVSFSIIEARAQLSKSFLAESKNRAVNAINTTRKKIMDY